LKANPKGTTSSSICLILAWYIASRILTSLISLKYGLVVSQLNKTNGMTKSSW
jgi:hypothetical protein